MRFIVVKKKTLLIAIAIILVVLLLVGVIVSLIVGGKTEDSASLSGSRKIPIYRVKTDEKKVALTFDAAWGADKTEGILEILKENDIKATFFLVGFWAKEYPEMVKKIDSAGMEIGTHTDTHPKMSTLSKEKMDIELKQSMEKIKNLTGKTPKVFRPPFGDYSNEVIETAENNSLYTIQWDVDSLDWKDLSAKEITLRVSRSVKNGSIILMHNNSTNILGGLRMTIDFLRGQGYSFCTVSELIYKDNYHIASDGEQIQN